MVFPLDWHFSKILADDWLSALPGSWISGRSSNRRNVQPTPGWKPRIRWIRRQLLRLWTCRKDSCLRSLYAASSQRVLTSKLFKLASKCFLTPSYFHCIPEGKWTLVANQVVLDLVNNIRTGIKSIKTYWSQICTNENDPWWPKRENRLNPRICLAVIFSFQLWLDIAETKTVGFSSSCPQNLRKQCKSFFGKTASLTSREAFLTWSLKLPDAKPGLRHFSTSKTFVTVGPEHWVTVWPYLNAELTGYKFCRFYVHILNYYGLADWAWRLNHLL